MFSQLAFAEVLSSVISTSIAATVVVASTISTLTCVATQTKRNSGGVEAVVRLGPVPASCSGILSESANAEQVLLHGMLDAGTLPR